MTINATEETISRSEKSYGSQLQNFTDIIDLLQRFGADYAPSNIAVKISTLQALQNEAILLNNKVSVTYGAFKPKINERQTGFKNLNDTANRIKEMVKSQYGIDSQEYKLIRKLNFSSKL